MAGKIVAEIWLDVRPFNGGPGTGAGGGSDDGAGGAATENALNNGVIIDSPDGGITFMGAGSIKGGKTAYDVGQGFWFGADGTDPLYYKVAIGDPNGDTFNWDGTQINSKMNNLELRGYLRGPADFVIDPAAHGDATGEVTIAGDLEIEGDTLKIPNDFTIDPATHGDDTGSLIIAGATLKVPDEFTIDPATHGDNTGEVNIAGSLEIAGDTLKVPNEFTIDPATHGDNTGEINIAGNLEVAGGTIKGPATIVIDPAVIGATSGLVQILGDLQVDGLTTTINSSVMTVDDKNIVIGEGATNAAAVNLGGITLEGANATLLYTSSDDEWNFNKGLNVTGDIDSTADITAVGALTGATLDIGGSDLTVNANGDLVTAGSISVAGTSNLNGNVNLGDATTDDIVFGGLVNSSIVPDGATHDLGTTTNKWRNLYIDTIYAAELNVGDGDFIVDEDGNIDANNATFASLEIDSATPGTILKQVSAQGNPMSIVAHTTMNIENVDSTAPGDATVLKYNNANTQYESVDFKTTSLEDVSTTTASDNQILKYNNANTQYEPVDHETSELEDVSNTAPTDEQVLQYNSTTSKYEPTTLTIGMFDDVTIADVQQDDLLVYQTNTADWRNKSKTGAGFAAIASSGSWNDLSNTPTTLAGYGITDAYTKSETYSQSEVNNLLYSNADVDAHLNFSTANTNDLLMYNGSDYEWVTYAEIAGAPETLGELNDVSLGTLASGEVLKYNGTNWVDGSVSFNEITNKPTTLAGYGITDSFFSGNYNDLTNKPTIPAAYTNSDVDAHLNFHTANTNDVLMYNGSDYEWVTYSEIQGAPETLGELSDVSLGTLNQNDYLRYDGSAWVDSPVDWTHIVNKPTFITSADLYTDADVDSHLNRSSAGTNQVLSFNGSDYAWVNQTAAGSNVQDLDDLSDVQLTSSLAAGRVLRYNGNNWTDAVLSFSDLGNRPTTIAGYGITDAYTDDDVDSHLNFSTANTNDVLMYNGSDYEWVNVGEVSWIVEELNDLSDVTISSPQNNNILAYNSTTSKFENTAFTIGKLSNVHADADSPDGTVQALGSNPSALLYKTSTSEWVPTPIELDDLYNVPAPASSSASAGDFLALKNNSGTSSVTHPEEYEWVSPRVDAGEDYEEGTFTVKLFDAASGGNSVTQSQANVAGTYTKIGRFCMCHINIFNANTTGLTSTNTLYFALPFTVLSDTFPLGQVNILAASSASASSMRHVYVYGLTGSPRGSFAMNPATSNGSATSFTVAQMVNDDSTDLRISLAFQTT